MIMPARVVTASFVSEGDKVQSSSAICRVLYADDWWAGLTALIEWVERMIAKSAVVKTELCSDYLELKSRQR